MEVMYFKIVVIYFKFVVIFLSFEVMYFCFRVIFFQFHIRPTYTTLVYSCKIFQIECYQNDFFI